NIFFIDPIPKVEIQSILSEFDACYIGLTKDPLFRFGVSPNKLFDYLYSGKPIVYGIESGEYKPIEDSKAGLQVPAQAPEQLADAVLSLYQMPAEERLAMGENGRKAALKQYEYGQLANQLIKVLFN
ncbi:glycosyltransferase WbuB, partial [Vibrio anguillarum]|nr:glycosyltransferase WbuB [Vibrio anguillarum]